MPQFVMVDSQGEPRYTVAPMNDTDYVPGQLYEEMLCYAIPDDISPQTVLESWYWVNNEQRTKPDKPTPHHVWDTPRECWVVDWDQLLARQYREIEAQRVLNTTAPLSYDGKMVDAGSTAQTNVKSKLEELRARIELNTPLPVEQLIWRDANNQLHTWTDQQAYYHWLLGYAIALSERTTQCYQVAWALKERLHAYVQAQDEDALLNFTV